MEKMTNVKALTYVVENCKMPDDVAEKIGNILATYEKKSASSAERKPTATQIANAETAENVGAWLIANAGAKFTAGEIHKQCPSASALPSTQKLTPMLTKLVADNVLAKETIKGRTYYTAVV